MEVVGEGATRPVADLPLTAKLHAAVAEAVAQKKAKAAAAASDRLMDSIEEFARKTLAARCSSLDHHDAADGISAL